MTKAIITWRGGSETVEATSLADATLSPLLERLARTRARDISVEFIDEPHVCDRNGLPTPVVEETGGTPRTEVYPTCATCGKTQLL
jgi:hypothetical protein